MATTVEPGLQQYFQRINESPLLSAKEEKELARAIAEGAAAAGRFARNEIPYDERERLEQAAIDARERMIRSNLRLVVNIAKKFTSRGMPLSDLIEEGNLGLMRAVEGFDPDIGARFSTYASWWIKQAIKRSLINTVQPVHIPAYMVELVARWKLIHTELLQSLGRAPTISEIAEKMQIPEQKVRMIKRAVRAIGSGAQAAANTSMGLCEMLPDSKSLSPDEAAFSEQEAETLQRLIDSLDDPREAEILRMRYGLDDQEPHSFKQIGDKIGLTRERVRQLEADALRKLHRVITQSESS